MKVNMIVADTLRIEMLGEPAVRFRVDGQTVEIDLLNSKFVAEIVYECFQNTCHVVSEQ